jgi:probable HAF family extracellular repeat protein
MKKESIVFMSALLVVLNSTLQAANIRYNLTGLGTLDGYEHSLAYSINNNGQIVGYARDDYNTRALLFDSTGGGNNIDLGTLGGESSMAYSINDNEQVVGLAEGDHYYCATIFDVNEQGNNVGLYADSDAQGNNDNGQIVGYVFFDPNDGNEPVEKAVIFSTNTEVDHIYLGALTGFEKSVALSINNPGQTVGFSFRFDEYSPYYYSRATLFDSNGTGNNIDLGTLGGDYSKAFSINNNCRIVGGAQNSLGQRRATIFDSTGDGNNIDLGTMTGQKTSAAFSINDNGEIVGVYYIEPYRDDHRAMMFDSTGGGDNVDLNNLINPALNWTLRGAMCINNNGWIVGSGLNPDGYHRAYLLTPAISGDFEPDRDIDFGDFAVLAAAWRSTPGEDNWNQFCDISEPSDNVINEKDLKVFVENWLSGF